MIRRRLLLLVGLAALAVSPASFAQKLYRIAFLGTGAASAMKAPIEAFKAGLKEAGYVDGKNAQIEYHWGEDRSERLAEIAADLVRRKMDVIVVWGTPAAFAAKRATSNVPIVMVSVGDPDESGLVPNLARPGGNITGVANLGGPVAGKQLDLLKQVIPGLARVAVLNNPGNRSLISQLKGAESAAKRLGLRLEVIDVRDPKDLDAAFIKITAARASGMLLLSDPMFVSERHRITALAAKHRLPAVSARSEIADAGLLMTYGASATEQFRSGALYVAKILGGAKPGELPIDQAVKFEFVINMKTASALGIKVPDMVVVRADRVIR